MSMTLTAHATRPLPWPALRPLQAWAGHDEQPAQDGLLLAMLDRVDYPLWLVAGDGTLLQANRQGRRLLACAGALQMDGRQVLATDAACQHQLLGALRAAVQGRRSLLRLTAGDAAPLMLAVSPLDNRLDAEPAVLLAGSRSQACEPLSLDFFARACGITQAEASVLRGLCEGQVPSEIARAAGVAVCTVRTQIASLRQKTATRTVGDLVRLVTQLPPIVGLLG